MKISEMIEKLQAIRNEHGDLDVQREDVYDAEEEVPVRFINLSQRYKDCKPEGPMYIMID